MTLAWLINRLKLMSVGEVLYRVKQKVCSSFEQLKLRRGWEPLSTSDLSTRLDILDKASITDSQIALAPSIANNLLQGKLSLFDYHELDVGWPIQWHKDPLTGIDSPCQQFGKAIDYRDDKQVGDIKVLWELGRQQFLVVVAVDYLVKREKTQLDVIAGTLNSWLEQNPYGYGVHWCSSLEVAIRGMSWSMCHQFLLAAGLPKGLFSLDINVRLLEKHIYQHAAFIRGHLSLYSSANNHLIGELTGLHMLCSVFAFGEESDCWRSFAWQSLLVESNKQVYSDGVNKEQAIYYHCWVLEYLIINYCIASHNEVAVPDAYAECMSRMAQFANDLSPMESEPPQIGDADDGVAILFNRNFVPFHRDLIEAINALSGLRPATPGSKAFWYHTMLKHGALARPEAIATTTYPAIYPHGGYAILGQPDFHAVFDCGALGYPSIAAHGHADILNLCLAVDGVWWLVDPGTYAYHSDHGWRDYFRGSRGHNVLTVSGADQSEIGGPFMWIRHAKAYFSDAEVAGEYQRVSGWHNGYSHLGAPRIDRRIEIRQNSGQLTLTDGVECSKPTDIAINYHFAPGVRCINLQSNTLILAKHGSNTRLQLDFPDTLTVNSYQGDQQTQLGWYSSSLGKKEPCLTIQASANITKTTTFTTRLSLVRD